MNLFGSIRKGFKSLEDKNVKITMWSTTFQSCSTTFLCKFLVMVLKEGNIIGLNKFTPWEVLIDLEEDKSSSWILDTWLGNHNANINILGV